MRVHIIVRVTILALTPFWAFGQQHQAFQNGSRLILKKPADRTRELAGSHYYVAALLNNSKDSLTAEAIQGPGGYAGSGKFFNCNLQVWNRLEWSKLWASADTGPKPHFTSVVIKPGEEKEVCRALLPSQAGAEGQCVRFKFQSGWKRGNALTLFSKPFVIGEKAPEETSNCDSK